MFSGLFGFKGRLGRGGWWFGQAIGLSLIGVIFAMAFVLHDPNRTGASNNDFIFLMLLGICVIVITVINICSTVKRYHDRGKSGWWYFVSLIPLIGGIWQLIECGFCSGDEGDNDYGPPPGSAQRLENLEREVYALGRGNLAKVDDDYIASYAQKLAMSQAQQQTAHGSVGHPGSTISVFGKR